MRGTTRISRFIAAVLLMGSLLGSPALGQAPAAPPRVPTTPTMPNMPGGDAGPGPSVPDILGAGNEGDKPGEPRPPASGGEAIANELCVVFAPTTAANVPEGFANDLDLEMVRNFTMEGLGLRVYLMRLGDGAEPDQVIEAAAADQRPLWVQPNYFYRTSDDSTAVANSQQYALRQMRADVAAPKTDGGAGIRIALIDSGVDTGHESLAGASIEAINLVEESDRMIAETHGTVLASILVGQGPLFGIVPKADLLAIRAFHETDPVAGGAESSSFLLSLGIETAIRRQARVINLSLTGPQDRLVSQLVGEALMRRVSVIAAAGNAGPKAAAAYPAAQDGVIAVTATDMRDQLFGQANRGDYISVAAPGVDILGAKPGGSYDFFSGTSMATGYASGLAALMLSRQENLGVTKLRQTMELSAIDLGSPARDPEFGAGRIDAAAAIDLLP